MMIINAKNSLFVIKRNVLLAFLITISFGSNVLAQAPCEPTSPLDIYNPVVHDEDCYLENLTNCVSNDLSVIDAFLDTGDPCNACDENNQVTANLMLTLFNDTGSERGSFAIFGLLETTDKNGFSTTCSISRCTGPIAPNSNTTLDYGEITFNCGDTLKLLDLVQSWTPANIAGSDCTQHDCKAITPKCRISPEIVIRPPLQATALAVCTSATTININLTVQEGQAPYTYAWTKNGDGGFLEVTEDLTGVGAGTYNVTVTDANQCTTMTSITPAICCEDANAGTNGNLNLCSSDATEHMLFASLTGADGGGTWKDPNGIVHDGKFTAGELVGDYIYTVTAPSPCSGDTSKVTVSVEDAKDPGTDGLLTICSSETLTAEMLFASLGAPKDVGGSWNPALSGAGDYTYTIAATNECPAVESKVTVSVEDSKDPGTDGLLTICSSETLTAEMLFASLGAPKDVGGSWSPALSGAGDYTYTIAATNECPAVESKVTVSVEDSKDPGTDGLLTICSSETLTAEMLFASLGAPKDVGGSWSPALSGAGDYTYTIAATNECPAVESKVTVSVEDAKDPGTDGLLTICSSETLTAEMLFASLGAPKDVGGSWSPALSGAGDYTYTIAATNECPAVESKVTVSVEDAKDPGTDGLLTICSSETLTAEMLFASLGAPKDVGGSWSPALSGAGDYTYTIAATNECPAVSAKVVVTEQSEILSSIQRTDVTCFNGNDGKLDLTVSGGSPPYTFLWSNGAKTKDIKDLTAGLYSVRITDARECTTENSARINEPDKLRARISCGHITCHSDVNGTLNLTVTGGTPPYTYLWNTGDTDEDLSGLPGGIYTVTVTDANDCTVEQSTVITQPDLLVCNIVQDNPCSSNGGSDGVATVTVSGGRTPYSYLWDNGETTATATSLTAGVHIVTVTDALNCQTTCEITITEPDILICSVELNNHVLCKGDSSGSATVNASDGAIPYTYLWDNGETTQTAVSLNTGLHSVTVTDAYQVVTSCTIMITEPDILEATAIGGSVISCSCYGGSDGSIDLTVIGGTPDYTYLWSNGATTEDLSGLLAGTYSVIVTDSNGCTTEEEIIISEPGMLSCEITQDSPVSYNGASDGIATVTPTAGTAPYEYLWSPGGATTAQATGLSAGNYTVTVTDYFGCETNCEITITEPNALRCDVAKNNDVSCYEGDDGSAKVTAEGGVPPYKYLWDNNEVTQTATSLNAGLHSVTVTDASQTETICNVRIEEPSELEASAEAEGATTYCSCYGASDGSIDLTVTGGTPDYTYLWSNGATTEDLSGLLAGTYSVVVTDANGCTTEEEVIISEPGMLSCEIIQDSVASAHDANDGVATVTPSGGTSPYTYLWDNGETTAQATSLNVGTHSVTVTDYFGCYTTCEIIIECLPNALRCDVAKNNDVSCYEGDDGSAKVTAEGGVPPYKYLWDNNEVTQTATSLNAGLHSVTVTDASQTETICNVRIEEPSELEASAEAEGATTYCSCYGASDGSIDLTVTGGTPDYTYLWSNGATTEDLSGLLAGTYSVVVTDANGCTTEEEVIISEPGMLSCEIIQDSVASAHDANDGVATVTPSGGTSPYTYLWDNGETTAQATSLNVGTHSVTVTDYFGCYTTCEIIIECLPNALRCDVAKNNDVSCYEGDDGSAKVTAEGGVPPYKYLWDNNEVTQTATSLNAGLHSVTVTDASQTETICNVRIEEPSELEASAEAEGATTYCSCYGASDGSIDLTVTGGTPDYTYLWSNGATSQDLSGLLAGTYSVVVTDSNGCEATEEVIVGEPGMLSCEITEYSPVSINGGSDGEATVSVEGGTPEYSYSWSPGGATTAQVLGLSAGNYTVTVTDSLGCETDCEVIITEPDPELPSASCSYTQGFYGNPGGLACIPYSQQVNAKYIMLGALNASGGQFDFGDKNTGKYFSLLLGDIQNDNIFKMLPGGGPSNKLQGYATYDLTATWDNVPLVDKGPRRGKIKNNLLSQTMTLYFNLHIGGGLSNYKLKETFYTAATVECGSEEYIENSVQMFKIPGNVISFLETNNSNTVQGLFDLANRALGGHNIGNLSYSSITEAVDAINNGFDECRVLLSETDYDKVVAGLTDDKPIFTIYPVPFVDTVKIKYEIDNGLSANIQVFDIRGRLVKIVVDKDIYYHKITTLDLDHTTFANQMYFVRITSGGKSTMKKIISIR